MRPIDPSSVRARARVVPRPRRKREKKTMTHKRRRVLVALIEARERGELVTLAEIARRTGLHDYRDARRTVRDLQAMGQDLRDVLRIGEADDERT